VYAVVAITVVLIIVGLLLLDLVVQFVGRWFEGRAGDAGEVLAPEASLAPEGGAAPFPPELFFDKNHAWARLDQGGTWRVGLDGSVGRLLGRVDQVVVVEAGSAVREGDPLATIRQGLHQLTVRSPVAGRVVGVNEGLTGDQLTQNPYEQGWLCAVLPAALADDTRRLTVGEDAARWHRHESRRLAEFLTASSSASLSALSEVDRARFQRTFLDAAA
jgi:glycine cleavage system H protein